MSGSRGAMIRVSTIIPVYNGAASVAAAIDSALGQDFDGQEIIVVNDGSTDATADVLARYGDQIRVISQPNRGVAKARNAGITMARGRYVALLDSDDVWLPNRLAATVAALEDTPEAVLAFSDLLGVDAAGEEVPHQTFDATNLTLERMLSSSNWAIYPSTVLMRLDVLKACGGFSREFQRPGFEDQYMWFVMREQGKFVQIKQALVIYRFPNLSEIADRYGPNRRIYFRLLGERYGRAYKPIRKETNGALASSLALKAFKQMEAANYSAALATWTRILCLRPSFFFKNGNFGRLLQVKNLKRMRALIVAYAVGDRKK